MRGDVDRVVRPVAAAGQACRCPVAAKSVRGCREDWVSIEPQIHESEWRRDRRCAAGGATSDVWDGDVMITGLSRAVIALDLSMVRRDFRAATVTAAVVTSAAGGWS